MTGCRFRGRMVLVLCVELAAATPGDAQSRLPHSSWIELSQGQRLGLIESIVVGASKTGVVIKRPGACYDKSPSRQNVLELSHHVDQSLAQLWTANDEGDSDQLAFLAAVWNAFDSVLVARLAGGASLEDIAQWAQGRSPRKPMTTRPVTTKIYGLGGDNILAITNLSLYATGGPSHIAVVSCLADHWRVTSTWNSEHSLEVFQLDPTKAGGAFVGIEQSTGMDATTTRAIMWSLKDGDLVEKSESQELLDASVTRTSGGVEISYPVIPDIPTTRVGPRLRITTEIKAVGSQVVQSADTLNPWLAAIDRAYMALGASDSSGAGAMASDSLLRRSTADSSALAVREMGDASSGRGEVRLLLTVSDTTYCEAIVSSRGADSSWRVTQVIHKETADCN